MSQLRLTAFCKDRGGVLLALSLLIILLAFSIAKAQQSSEPSWAEQLTKEQRFLVFPHIDAGFRAQQRNDFDRAIKEFTRANEIAPSQPVIIGYLAQALADTGQLSQAIAVLSSQLSLTPDDKTLLKVKRSFQERQNTKYLWYNKDL
jgi:tetratricopeptide (TPR) repeat protein